MEVDDIVFSIGGPRIICVAIPIVDDLVSENCAEMFGSTITSEDERVNDPTDMVIIQIDDDDGEWIGGMRSKFMSEPLSSQSYVPK